VSVSVVTDQDILLGHVPDDSHLPLAVRRQCRQPCLPKRFRDTLPQPSAALPPSEHPDPSDATNACISALESPQIPPTIADHSQIHSPRRILKSPQNIFGLFRQYHARDFPSHDPEELVTLHEMWDASGATSTQIAHGSFGPYPNQSSFLLGEWFWGEGVQKSKRSFKELVDIIGGPEFNPADIRETKWDRIDHQLGNGPDGLWVDEPDANWVQTPVTILVPFSDRMSHPGAKEFVIPDFYHRSVVGILREQVERNQHFHFEPFELHWQQRDASGSARVYSELYNSSAFLEEHEKLQNSPTNLGCDLPRVVVGLMFASDATQLTSFGQASLWPLYMQFGNDSKYRRGKPSLHLCNHVAYFQKVGIIFAVFSVH
jgi:hypothetical protein